MLQYLSKIFIVIFCFVHFNSCAQKVVSDTEYVAIAEAWHAKDLKELEKLYHFFYEERPAKAYIAIETIRAFLAEVKAVHSTAIFNIIDDCKRYPQVGIYIYDIIAYYKKSFNSINFIDKVNIGKSVKHNALPSISDILKKYVYPAMNGGVQNVPTLTAMRLTSMYPNNVTFTVTSYSDYWKANITIFVEKNELDYVHLKTAKFEVLDMGQCDDGRCEIKLGFDFLDMKENAPIYDLRITKEIYDANNKLVDTKDGSASFRLEYIKETNEVKTSIGFMQVGHIVRYTVDENIKSFIYKDE